MASLDRRVRPAPRVRLVPLAPLVRPVPLVLLARLVLLESQVPQARKDRWAFRE